MSRRKRILSKLPVRRHLEDDPSAPGLLARLRRRYFWWNVTGGEPDDDRVVAQVMDIGTYGDVKRLERAVGRERLKHVLTAAEPGRFSPQSWSFWHVVLGLTRLGAAPPRQPARRGG